MNYRIANLLYEEDATVATTKTIDLDLAKPVSRIMVQMRLTNNGSDPTGHPARAIKKVELIDGSNVLYSLSGIQAQALNFYETGRVPMNFLNFIDDTQAIATMELNFGRFLYDEFLAFDPKQFQNPQIKITHDKSLGGSSPDAAKLSVIAFCFDDKDIKPEGFLISKEQYGYTLVASAKENIELARDMVYRMIMIQSLTALKQPWEQFNKVKLTENNDEKVVINDESTSNLLKALNEYPRIVEGVLGYDLGGTQKIYFTPGYEIAISALGMNEADTALYTEQGFGGAAVVVGTASKIAQFNVSGVSPHNSLPIFTGKKDVVEDWWDVRKLNSLRLILTAGSGASGTCEVVSQQLKKYGEVA